VGLHLDDRRKLRHGPLQVCNERRLPCRVMKAQGPSKDQVGPRRGPHAHTISAQVGAMDVVQRGQDALVAGKRAF
jgi:hypothetical protein